MFSEERSTYVIHKGLLLYYSIIKDLNYVQAYVLIFVFKEILKEKNQCENKKQKTKSAKKIHRFNGGG